MRVCPLMAWPQGVWKGLVEKEFNTLLPRHIEHGTAEHPLNRTYGTVVLQGPWRP